MSTKNDFPDKDKLFSDWTAHISSTDNFSKIFCKAISESTTMQEKIKSITTEQIQNHLPTNELIKDIIWKSWRKLWLWWGSPVILVIIEIYKLLK